MSAPIRILFVIDQMLQLGGAEQNLLRLLRGLPRDRFEPRLLTFDFNPEVFPSIPCPMLVYPIRRIYGWNGLRYSLRFRRLLHEEKIDIVHTFFESSDFWAAPLARAFRAVVLVSSRRDLGIQRHRLHDFAYRAISPLFDQVQAVSEEVRDYVLRADRIPPGRVVTVTNGIDLDAVEPAPRDQVRQRYGWSAAELLVVSVGNIRHVKGYDVLLRTAALVCRRIPARFVIAGRVLEPEHYNQLLASIKSEKLEGRVEFLGPVERPFDLLNAADVFFLPSRSEGMSNALLEAMACGLPAVATSVGGNRELIADGENGFLVPVGAEAAASDRLVALLQDPVRRSAMGQAGREIVKARYSMAAVIERMTREYERLLAGRGSR